MTDPDFHGELRRILMDESKLDRTFSRVVDIAYGFTIAFLLVCGAMLLVGCGDDLPQGYREALQDMVAETQVYGERCGLEPWQVNDYERLVCGWAECNPEPDGSITCWEQKATLPCDAMLAPIDYDAAQCFDDLAEMPCDRPGVALPDSCQNLIPWERGT